MPMNSPNGKKQPTTLHIGGTDTGELSLTFPNGDTFSDYGETPDEPLIRKVIPLSTLEEVYMMSFIAQGYGIEAISSELNVPHRHVLRFIVKICEGFGIAPGDSRLRMYAGIYINNPEALVPSSEAVEKRKQFLSRRAAALVSEVQLLVAEILEITGEEIPNTDPGNGGPERWSGEAISIHLHLAENDEPVPDEADEENTPRKAEEIVEHYELTPRERQFLECIGSGMTIKQIAAQEHLALATIYKTLHHAYKKINVRNRLEATFWAQRELLGRGDEWAERIVKKTGLTPQELEVARLLYGGMRGREIAKVMHIAESSVSTHKKNIYRKFSVTSAVKLKEAVDDLIAEPAEA
jgi:DNA-binding NarL/FixJ family response regulator